MTPSSVRMAVQCIAVWVVVLLFLQGAAYAGQKKDIEKFNIFFENAQYDQAADFELERIGGKRQDKAKLLQSMQAAAALRYCNRLELSSLLFDECEAIIKEHDEKLFASNAASSAGSVLLNDSSLDYKGSVYDGVMVNTYKALNFWQEGKIDLARIEFNRALDRQRRAVERFASEIARQKEEIARKQADGSAPVDLEGSANSPQVRRAIENTYSNLFEFAAYPDFVNPFTTYAAGLFFMSQGDYPKASTLFKEVAGMTQGNAVVMGDLAEADGLQAKGRHVWVVFENGSGPVKEEVRLDLPLFLVTSQIKYTGIALPKLVLRENGCQGLSVMDGAQVVGSTELLSSMDRVVQTEFKKRYPAILRRAILSAAMKTVVQNQAQKQFGDIGGILGGLMQRATTIADTRMWTALPKEFQIARVRVPKSGVLDIETAGGRVFSVTVPIDGSSMVYVKVPAPGATPFCSVTPMNPVPVAADEERPVAVAGPMEGPDEAHGEEIHSHQDMEK
ncbi:COG3014 family protein [Pelodictyon luteolum]|uniref:Tetratricopeptide repeat protein n=1 Tax=Chlorobium luteolum (strain DSM 273 / BCRC 81028 / 2530) TaxID=319225 RepID=Q3B6Q9_CHLL3|nr:hypothetical protein [Pelodictyon luteolum]ABB22972.1 conserved hypothetical protein [Pelodictyon luteolum DSM 273]